MSDVDDDCGIDVGIEACVVVGMEAQELVDVDVDLVSRQRLASTRRAA